MIDGETLPFLTEDHLLDTMGLKLGPALKIRSQVYKPSKTVSLTNSDSRPKSSGVLSI